MNRAPGSKFIVSLLFFSHSQFLESSCIPVSNILKYLTPVYIYCQKTFSCFKLKQLKNPQKKSFKGKEGVVIGVMPWPKCQRIEALQSGGRGSKKFHNLCYVICGWSLRSFKVLIFCTKERAKERVRK